MSTTDILKLIIARRNAAMQRMKDEAARGNVVGWEREAAKIGLCEELEAEITGSAIPKSGANQ